MMKSIFSDDCVHHYNIEILNIFDPELQPINCRAIILKKLKDALGELKKFKVQTIFAIECKRTYYHKSMRKAFHFFIQVLSYC